MSSNTNKKIRNRKRKQNNLPIYLILGGILLFAGALFALNNSKGDKTAIEVTGAPSLRVDQEKVDLGDVKLGKTVEVSFNLSNAGDQPLQFTDFPYIEVVEGC